MHVRQRARCKPGPQRMTDLSWESQGWERPSVSLRYQRAASAFHLFTHNKKTCTKDCSTPLCCFIGFQKDLLPPCWEIISRSLSQVTLHNLLAQDLLWFVSLCLSVFFSLIHTKHTQNMSLFREPWKSYVLRRDPTHPHSTSVVWSCLTQIWPSVKHQECCRGGCNCPQTPCIARIALHIWTPA